MVDIKSNFRHHFFELESEKINLPDADRTNGVLPHPLKNSLADYFSFEKCIGYR